MSLFNMLYKIMICTQVSQHTTIILYYLGTVMFNVWWEDHIFGKATAVISDKLENTRSIVEKKNCVRFSVRTYIKPNLVFSKISFMLGGGGGELKKIWKKFFWGPKIKVAQNGMKHGLVLEFLRSDEIFEIWVGGRGGGGGGGKGK